MSKITVFQFTVYDIRNDQDIKSHRWATREAIVGRGGKVLEQTATEVDVSVVGSEISGMTERGFDPHKPSGV